MMKNLKKKKEQLVQLNTLWLLNRLKLQLRNLDNKLKVMKIIKRYRKNKLFLVMRKTVMSQRINMMKRVKQVMKNYNRKFQIQENIQKMMNQMRQDKHYTINQQQNFWEKIKTCKQRLVMIKKTLFILKAIMNLSNHSYLKKIK